MSVATYEKITRKAGCFLGLSLLKEADGTIDGGVAFLCGSGVPASATYGGHTLASGQNAIAIDADAATVATLMYETVDGGTTWTAVAVGGTTDFGAGGLKTDLIVESTGDAGVTMEGIKFEDETTSVTITTSNVPVAWTHTANGAADDLTITVAGATDSSLGLVSQGTGLDAVYVTTTAGGIKLQSASGLSEAITGAIGITATGAYNLDTAGLIALESSGGRIDIGTDNVNQAINIGTAGVRAISIGSATSHDLTLEAGTGALNCQADESITLHAGTALYLTSSDTPVYWQHTTDGDAEDLTIQVAGATNSSLILTSSGTGADAIGIHATAGGIDMDCTGAFDLDIGGGWDIDITGALAIDATGNISIDSSAGTISIGEDNVAQALNLGTGGARAISLGSAASASLLLEAGVGALTVNADTTMGLTIGGAATFTLNSTWDVNAVGAVTIDSSAGPISIGADAVAQAVNIGTGGAARPILVGNAASASLGLEAGVGALTMNADAASTWTLGNTLTVNVANALAITSATAASSWQHTADHAADDLTIAQLGAVDASLYLTAAGTGGDAVRLQASAGGVDMDAALGFSIEAAGGAIAIGTDAVAQAVNIATGAAARAIMIGNAASASLGLEAGVGALTVNADAASTWTLGNTLTVNVANALAITSATAPSSWQHTADHAADDLTIAQLGAVDASLYLTAAGTGTDAVRIQASAGGIDVDAALGFSLEAAGGAIGIGTANVAQEINLGTGGVRPINIGSAAAASVAIDGGVGACGIQADAQVVLTAGTFLDLDATTYFDLATGTYIDIDAGSTLDINSVGTFTLGSGAALIVSSANEPSGWTHTANGAADDLTIAVAGAVDASLYLTSTGTGADAIRVNASAGGIDVDASGDINVDAANVVLTATTDVQLGDGGNPTLTLAGTGNVSVEADKRVVNTAAEVLVFDDDVAVFADPADPTKRCRLDSVNVTAGQTRVLTAPDADWDMGEARRDLVNLNAHVMVADSAALTNSAAETVLGTHTIVANAIGEGTRIKIRWFGAVTADAAATTLTIRVKVGAQTIYTSAAVNTSAGFYFAGEAHVITRAAPSGASATRATVRSEDPYDPAAPTPTTLSRVAWDLATNAAVDVVLTGQWSAADANSCYLGDFDVEVFDALL